VGPTAKAKKGTAWSVALVMLRQAEPAFFGDVAGGRILGGFGSGEAIVDAVRDADPDTPDLPAASDKRLLVLETEFARLLKVAGREGSTVSQVMRDAWDGKKLQTRARTRTAVATGYAISLVAHSTIEELRARLSDIETYSGTTNRLLWVLVRRSEKRHPAGGNVPDEVAQHYGRIIGEAIAKARAGEDSEVRRTPAAEALWVHVYDLLGDDDPGGLLGAAIARAEPYVLRLSLLYALLDGADVVDVPHIRAAYALWRYCRASAAYIFGDTPGDPVADKLLAFIRAAGESTHTEQRDHFGRHNSKAIEIAREWLLRRGLIAERERETAGRWATVNFATEATEATEALPPLAPDACDRSDRSP
jgi:hypothetical protein